MTTSTPHLSLTLYNSSTDQAELFSDFRATIAGTATTSNFYKVDTAVGSLQTSVASLLLARGAIPVDSTYSAPNTYVATVSSITAYTTGLGIILSVDTTSNGTVTLNINSLGAKSVMKVNSSGTPINLTGADLGKGRYYLFVYDGTRFLWVSANAADQINIVGTSGNIVTVGSDNTLLGTTTPSANISGTIHAATAKTSPVDADEIGITDSAASYALKTLSLTNLWTNYIKTKGDATYAALAGSSSQAFSVGTATAIAHAPRTNQIQSASLVSYSTGGTSTAFTITTLGTPMALTTNETWNIIFHTNPGTNPTLNRDSLGAKSIKYWDYSGTKQNISTYSVISGNRYVVMYDGTDYVVMNPLAVNGAASSTDGNIVIWDGTSGRSLKDSSLPFVTETEFTPAVEGTTTAGTATYNFQVGAYSRIGNVVFFQTRLSWGGHTGTGSMIVTGLPVTASATTALSTVAVYFSALTLTGNEYKVEGFVNASSTSITLHEVGGGVFSALPMDASGTLRISGHYFAA